MAKKKRKPGWKCIGENEFCGDIVITDPCYIGHSFDWDGMMDFFGQVGLISRTFYGDWGCTVFKTGKKVGSASEGQEELGQFCADAGMVCVLDMNRVLELDPAFQDFIDNHGWCVTVIRGFRGKIRLVTKTQRGFLNTKSHGRVEYEDVELRVHGDGEVDGKPFSFESVQTSM